MPTLSNGSSPRRQGAHFSSPVPEGQAQEEQAQQEQITQPSVEATGSLPASFLQEALKSLIWQRTSR